MNRHKSKRRRTTKQNENIRKKQHMQTKRSVTNSIKQPFTLRRENHAAMKLPAASTLIAAFGLISMLVAMSGTAQAQGRDDKPPVVVQAAGPDASSIQGALDSFRALLGDNNLNNPGPIQKGRREINWDGGNPNVLDTTAPVNPFLTFLNTRGSQFKTPGVGLSQAPPSGGPQGGLAVLFGNPTYSKIFRAFSNSRLFTPVGSNITEASFAIPGTNGLAPATVKAFGAVFTDVDQPDGRPGPSVSNRTSSTFIEYFDANGRLLFTSSVPASPGNGNFSFFGIVFDDARIASVRIKTGDVAPGANDDRRHDIVMMDDFVYSEPQLLK